VFLENKCATSCASRPYAITQKTEADLLDELSKVGSYFYRISAQLLTHSGIATPSVSLEKLPIVVSNWSLIFVSGWKFNHALKRRANRPLLAECGQ
jgi:hypothetical protein